MSKQQIIAQPITHSILVQDERGEVIIQAQVPAVSVLQVGTQGPPGPIGPPGTDKNHVHNQIAPSTQWNIQHNLGKFPSVRVVDSGDNVVVGDIQDVDENSLIISFTAAFGGKAYLN